MAKASHAHARLTPAIRRGRLSDCAAASSRFVVAPMIRRHFFVLLLLILPLQAVWAAASAYCLHEQGVATQHFGHHDHRHHAGSADGKDGAGKATVQPHPDCGICHLNCPTATSASSLPLPAVLSPFLAADPFCALPSVFPEGPERPNWAPAEAPAA